MKRLLSLSLTALTAAFTSFVPIKQATANTFSEQQVDQQKLVAVAVPFGYENHSLTIIEQIPGQQKCWEEQGTFPVTIDPLLLNFDFTGSCRRATDTNGYSIRIDGQDRTNYQLNIVDRNGELHLIATHPDSHQPELLIGRSYGLNHDKSLTKIFLNPGWQITKRVYQGQTLGHFYLSGNSRAIAQNSLFPAEYDNDGNFNAEEYLPAYTEASQVNNVPSSLL